MIKIKLIRSKSNQHTYHQLIDINSNRIILQLINNNKILFHIKDNNIHHYINHLLKMNGVLMYQ